MPNASEFKCQCRPQALNHPTSEAGVRGICELPDGWKLNSEPLKAVLPLSKTFNFKNLSRSVPKLLLRNKLGRKLDILSTTYSEY